MTTPQEQVVQRAAEWARTAHVSDPVGLLWQNLSEGSRQSFENERDFADRVNERIGLMEN